MEGLASLVYVVGSGNVMLVVNSDGSLNVGLKSGASITISSGIGVTINSGAGVTIQSGVSSGMGVLVNSGVGVQINSGVGVALQSGISSGMGVQVNSGHGVIINSGVGVTLQSGISSGMGVQINSGVGITVNSGVIVASGLNIKCDSGHVVQIGDTNFNQIANVTSLTVDNIASNARNALNTLNYMAIYDVSNTSFNRLQTNKSGLSAAQVACSGYDTIVQGGVATVRGLSVANSGASVQPFITAASGGQAFFSGNCTTVMVQYSPSSPVAGIVYISSSGQATSGFGIAIMSGAAPISFGVNQAQKLYAVSSVSGVLLGVATLMT